jgi:hypothetical protein
MKQVEMHVDELERLSQDIRDAGEPLEPDYSRWERAERMLEYPKVLLSSSPEALRAALAPYASTATVEAEYGDVVVEGSLDTLAHHGPRAKNPAPCLRENRELGVECVGVSHLDLDALGGVLAILGRKPEAEGFWKLAAYVDTHGPHRLGEAGAEPVDVARLHAFWAWSEMHRVFPPRDGGVLDVTDRVEEAKRALVAILDGDQSFLRAGEEFARREEELNSSSFVQVVGEVIVRVSPAFVNHLYATPDGRICRGVVSFNATRGEITASLAEPVPGVSCRKLVQELWGPRAGGHDGIAGSPRGERRSLEDLQAAAERLASLVEAAG